jgi:hypothetical protein
MIAAMNSSTDSRGPSVAKRSCLAGDCFRHHCPNNLRAATCGWAGAGGWLGDFGIRGLSEPVLDYGSTPCFVLWNQSPLFGIN